MENNTRQDVVRVSRVTANHSCLWRPIWVCKDFYQQHVANPCLTSSVVYRRRSEHDCFVSQAFNMLSLLLLFLSVLLLSMLTAVYNITVLFCKCLLPSVCVELCVSLSMPPCCLYHLCLPTEESSDEENTPVLNRFTRKFAFQLNTLMLMGCLKLLFFLVFFFLIEI